VSSKKRQVRRSALKEPVFLRYFPASWFSSLGSWMVRFLLGWSAWEITHSASWVGLTAALMLGPVFVLSPLFGIVSDRINPRHGLVISMLVHACIALAGGASMLAGIFDLPLLMMLALALGAATSWHTPMRLALIPVLVCREALPSAVGLSAMTFNTARILGPAAGAWLLEIRNVADAFFIGTLMFVISAAILVGLRGVGSRTPREREPLAAQFRAGLRYVRHSEGLRLIFALTVVNGLLGRTVIELLPALNGFLLGAGSSELATLTGSAGVGSIVGGLVLTRQHADNSRLFHLVSLSVLLAALLLLTLEIATDLWRLAFLILLLSLFTTVAGTACQTITQLSVHEDYRGRVVSLWTLAAMGSPAFGAALIGALAEVWGFISVLVFTGITGVIVMAWLYTRRGRLASLSV